MNTPHVTLASVHGRFQPFHNEHLDYVRKALDRAEFLHVGITQVDRSDLSHIEGAGNHRGAARSNPLSYFERVELVRLALAGDGVSSERFWVGPFPIENPQVLTEYLPLAVPILSTRVDEWNDAKLEILRNSGYSVEYMFDRDPRGVSGSEIRELIAAGDRTWIDMVPAATVPYLDSLNLAARLRVQS